MEVPANLSALVDHWVADGIITHEQAERIRSEQQPGISPRGDVPSAVPAHRDRGPLVAEALGYLAGVLILVAAGLLTAQFWEDMPLGVRLAMSAGAAASLCVAGAAVPERLGPAGRRLRSVLWLLCIGAVGAFLVLLASDGLGWKDEDVALLAGGGAAVVAGACGGGIEAPRSSSECSSRYR